MLRQVALVSQSKVVRLAEAAQVGAALQKQVSRDVGPIWSVDATVDVFGELSEVPLGYWPVLVRDDVSAQFGAAGIHLDTARQPFALVQADPGWALAASHEVLEMLVDPYGDRLVAGDAPREARDHGRVEYLVEICDPSEAAEFGYTVNGVRTSDFYTPAFFDPVPVAGVRYSFTGAVKAPRQVLRGGYLSWRNPLDTHWYQLRWFTGPRPAVVDLGIFEGTSSTREWVDRQTEDGRGHDVPRVIRARPSRVAVAPAIARASHRRAAELSRDVSRVLLGADA